MQNVGDLGGGGVVCGQGSGEASQILFITEDAAVSVAAVTQATQKTKKSSTRKNMNEEAGNYYSEMLKIQKEVALKRMKLLTEKIRNEVMMGKILEKKLMKVLQSGLMKRLYETQLKMKMIVIKSFVDIKYNSYG